MVEPDPYGPGPIERAVLALAAELSYPEGDPRFVIGLLAVQVARAVDQRPAETSLTRELRLCLSHFAELPNEAPGMIDEIRAAFLMRRTMSLIGGRDGHVAAADDVDEFATNGHVRNWGQRRG